MPGHVVLVGMMGSGKSTVGGLLAHRLQRPLVDTDLEVERRAGSTVRELIERVGEPAFRDLESEVLLEALAAPQPAVVAAAGGAVLRDRNRDALRDPAHLVVLLDTPVDELVRRVEGGAHRPLLDGDPAGRLAAIHAERSAIYREVADVIVPTAGTTPADLAEAIEALVAGAVA